MNKVRTKDFIGGKMISRKEALKGLGDPETWETHPVRPVKCHFCKQQMLYLDNPNHVPEVRIELHGHPNESGFYVHLFCWDNMISTFRDR